MSTLTLTDSVASISGELCRSLALLHDALTVPCAACISEVSECHRRAASQTADTLTYLFGVFCPSLERAPCVLVCEKLQAAVGAVLEAGLCLPASYTPNVRMSTEMQGLCRMGEYLHQAVLSLPRFIKGHHPPLPDTYRFHAEHTKVRAAHALRVLHNDKEPHEHAVSRALERVAATLVDAYSALLFLLAQSV